ncbi:SRPBCC family protein [Sorangium sp. So ce385]|uniref:SRPBCC family protein n=1 Tax=Sorangium sp. So ce385 TaxID=3133308 RepID=UPI003F5C0EE1
METTNLEVTSEREIVITRTFSAPRRIVFDAMTKPEYVKRWYGLRVLTMSVCEIDLRVGGRWRYVLRAPDGSEHGFTGVYREIVRPERVVCTENYEPLGPGHEMLVTATYDERDGKTTLTSRIVYQSQADRDAHLQSGMEAGMRETFDRLAEILSALASGGFEPASAS